MCYDLSVSIKTQLFLAEEQSGTEEAQQLALKLVPQTDLPLHHSSGFEHPTLLAYTQASPQMPHVAQWGLIPPWAKDWPQAQQWRAKTLNARGETMVSKPAFREAAQQFRCLFPVDGFFEHHHHQAKTYPYYIYARDASPLVLAGLASEWVDRETGEVLLTFSIVTTRGNALLTKIHNNPKLAGPRMPVILSPEQWHRWLDPALDLSYPTVLDSLLRSYPEEKLAAHTVARLRGREYAGNLPSIKEPVAYEALPNLS